MSDAIAAPPLSPETEAEIERLIREYLPKLPRHVRAETEPSMRNALRYAARGFRVTSAHEPHPEAGCTCNLWRYRRDARAGIPPENRAKPECAVGKHPVSARWQEVSTTNLRTVAAQFVVRFWRNKKLGTDGYLPIKHATNVCIVTGEASGYFALDVDGEAGLTNLAKMEAQHGPLPPTPTSVSGSGTGRHYLFRSPPGVKLYNSQKRFGWAGSDLDIRGENGQIIVAPSLHKSGGRYQWLPGLSPDDVLIADAPAWVIEAAQAASKKSQTSAPEPEAADDDDPEKEQCDYKPKGKPIKVDAKGFESILKTYGDGDGLEGFHGPTFSTMCSWFHPANNGPDSDAELLKARLRDAITAAPKKPERPATDIERYLSDGYLDEHIDDARAFIRSTMPVRFADFAEAEAVCKVKKDATAEQRLSLARRVGVSDLDPDQTAALLAMLKTTGLTEAALKKAAQRARREFVKVEMPAAVAEIAKRWATITIRGQVCAAMLPEKAGQQPNLMQFHQFMHRSEAVIPVAGQVDDKGQPKRAGQAWHDTPEFRTDYDGIGFAPPGAPQLLETCYNVFNGWPELADCSGMTMRELATACRRYLMHIRRIVCNGDPKLYRWVLTFIADMLKNPGMRVRVALCLRGDEGAGKGTLYQVLKDYLGGYYLKVSRTADLVGRFNEELANKILVVSEEAHHSGDQAASKTLRDMVTATDFRCEPKHLAAYMLDKYFRLIFIANKGAVVAVGEDDRRYTIADVSDELVTLKRADPAAYHAYFEALYGEMANGGVAAFVELMTRRWRFDRSILNETVRTEAHADHVRANLNPVDRWIIEAVARGAFVDPRGNLPEIALEGDEAIRCKRKDGSDGIALPLGQVMDLFRAAIPGHYAQRDHGTPDAIHDALKRLMGAEDELKQPRGAGSNRPRCFIVQDLLTIRGTLVIRGLIRDGVFADGGDDDNESDEDQDDGRLMRVATTKAYRDAKAETLGLARAINAFLAHPAGVAERVGLWGAYDLLATKFEAEGIGNVVPIRPKRSGRF